MSDQNERDKLEQLMVEFSHKLESRYDEFAGKLESRYVEFIRKLESRYVEFIRKLESLYDAEFARLRQPARDAPSVEPDPDPAARDAPPLQRRKPPPMQ